MRDKLIVSGCSYTEYLYPTWGDWLGEHFDTFHNLGVTGSGPKYTYLAIADFFKYNKVNPKEYIVIAQWSSLLRRDIRSKTDDGWLHGGQIDNNSNYSKDYLKKYFHPLDTANDLVHYIDHLILLSEKLGFKLYMTYMFEPWIDNFLGEPVYSTIDKNEIKDTLRSKYMISLKEISKSKYWINPSIESFSLDNPSRHIIKTTINGKPSRDHHPSPFTHFLYAWQISKLLKIKLNKKYKKLSLDLTRFLATNYNDLKFIELHGKKGFHKQLEQLIKKTI